jgi:hypothetical protein
MRVVWPVALGFFDHARMLAAWCETREGFRHFRLDRMEKVALLDERPPKRRRTHAHRLEAGGGSGRVSGRAIDWLGLETLLGGTPTGRDSQAALRRLICRGPSRLGRA